MGICSIEGCGRKTYALGLCGKHYGRLRTTGTVDDGPFAQEPLEKRFWKKVDKRGEDECWEWIGAVSHSGYGVISFNGTNKGAHRVSYELCKGQIHEGMHVLHSCDNPKCVNPNHLRSGTPSENIQEAFDKGRKTATVSYGERNPRSKLTLEQVKFIKLNPQLGHKAIADMFGLSPNAIRGVRIGRTWRDA